MSGDPIQALIDRSKQELTAVNQQIEAARTTLRSMEDTFKSTQKQNADVQERAAASQAKVTAADTRAREVMDVANRAAAKAMDDAQRRIAAEYADHSARMRELRESATAEAEKAEARLVEATQKHRDVLAATSVAQQKLDAIKRQASEFAKS